MFVYDHTQATLVLVSREMQKMYYNWFEILHLWIKRPVDLVLSWSKITTQAFAFWLGFSLFFSILMRHCVVYWGSSKDSEVLGVAIVFQKVCIARTPAVPCHHPHFCVVFNTPTGKLLLYKLLFQKYCKTHQLPNQPAFLEPSLVLA